MKSSKIIKKRNYPKAQTGLEIGLVMNLLSSMKGKGKGGDEGGSASPLDLLSRFGDQLKSFTYPILGVSNMFKNAQVAKDEKRKYLESIQPKAQYSQSEDGLNNLPMYYKKGGYKKYQLGALAGVAAGAAEGAGAGAGLGSMLGNLGGGGGSKTSSEPPKNAIDNLLMIKDDPALQELFKLLQFKDGGLTNEKARKILHDGTVHGKKLTPKQRRFFGAMSHMQTGGEPSNDLRGEWNNYVTWLESQGMKGKPELDSNNLGFKYLENYRKINPNSPLTKEKIPEIQGYLQDYRNWVIEGHKSGKRPVSFTETPLPDYSNFMSNLSRVDGYPGQYTTSVKFPVQYMNDRKEGFASIVKNKQTGGYVKNDVLELTPDEIKQLQSEGYQFELAED